VAGGIGPQGPSGDAGTGGGASLSNDTPLAPGTASAGTASTASRSDHRHAPPTIGDISGLQAAIDGKQAAGSYAAASHTHTSSQITDFATAVAAAAPATTNASLLTSGTIDVGRLPTISYTALSNVPTTFTPATHTHSLSSLTQSSATTGQVATWDGSAWSPATPTPATTDASALTSGTLSDSRLSSNVITNALLSARQHQTTSALDVIDRTTVSLASAPLSGSEYWTFFTPTYNLTVSQISYASVSPSSGVTLARMGLYTMDASGAGTLVARTASDTTLFTGTNTVYTRSFDSTGGYPTTYNLVAGTRYAVAFCLAATSPQAIAAGTCHPAVAVVSPRVQGVRHNSNDLLTTQATGSYNGTTTAAYWARLS
jgi:hypothetical protein